MLLKDLNWEPISDDTPYVRCRVGKFDFYRTKDWLPNTSVRGHVAGPVVVYSKKQGIREMDLVEAQCMLNSYLEGNDCLLFEYLAGYKPDTPP